MNKRTTRGGTVMTGEGHQSVCAPAKDVVMGRDREVAIDGEVLILKAAFVMLVCWRVWFKLLEVIL